MSDDQVLEHFKEVLPPETEALLLEINYIDTEIGIVRAFMLLYKYELIQSTHLSVSTQDR